MAINSSTSIQNINNRRSGSGKTNALLNLIVNQPDIDKIYLYVKDPYEAKYQYLINKWEIVEQNHFNDPKAFIDYSNDMNDVYKNIAKHNIDKERKILIVFDDMIADMINNKELSSIVTELFIRSRKLIILLFLWHSHTLKFQKMLDWILFYCKNSKQKRTSTNCNKSFIGY